MVNLNKYQRFGNRYALTPEWTREQVKADRRREVRESNDLRALHHLLALQSS